MERSTRRHWLAWAAGAAVGAVAGGAYRVASRNARGEPLLRPPGAQTEKQFLAACIRCGQCVQACPYDALRFAGLDRGVEHGTPYVVPADVPCFLCLEYDRPPCIDACPTDALTAVDDIRNVRMGTAVIDPSICLPFQGTVCRACWHACPFPNEAIRLGPRLRPVVVEDACVGCGLCEHACPTQPRSIVVHPATESKS